MERTVTPRTAHTPTSKSLPEIQQIQQRRCLDINRMNEGFQWLSYEAVSEEDVSRTMVSTWADSGAMHRD